MSSPADQLDLVLVPRPGGEVLYQSARATVIWGDCRDPAVITQVPNGYGLLCTDPPYGVNWRSSHGKNFAAIEGDDGTTDWPGVLREWIGPTGTESGLADKRHVYVFGYPPNALAEPLRLGGTAELIWDKAQTGLGDLSVSWGNAHEKITFGAHIKRPSGRARGDGRLVARLRRGSVIRVPRPNAGAATRHPTEKPVALMAQLIESSTVGGDLVVDPCAGSGSTGVAAILEGRRCFLVEYDRGYAELAVERIRAAERIADQIAAA